MQARAQAPHPVLLKLMPRENTLGGRDATTIGADNRMSNVVGAVCGQAVDSEDGRIDRGQKESMLLCDGDIDSFLLAVDMTNVEHNSEVSCFDQL